MSTSVELPGLQQTWSPPAATPLNEAVWQAWVARGRAQQQRSSATRIRALKWASITVLLGTAGLWFNLAPFEVLVRFLVTASAIALMFQSLQTRYYPVAATFGALALLFNPVAPLLEFSGGWQRAVVVASAVPFVASLVWPNGRNRRMESNG
jgi:hypothetical protein